MIKFNFQKTSQTPTSFFYRKTEINNYLTKLRQVLKGKNYNIPESFLLLPKESIGTAKQMFSYHNKFQLILLCGVGGSSLGAQAVYEALKNKKSLKKLVVLDSLNPLFFKKSLELSKKTKKGTLVIFFISKSGKTFETTANFFALLPFIKKYQPNVFVISDENSILWQYGKKNNFETFSIPKAVGGRYSLFSLAHLLPLSFSGINVKELLFGAKEANRFCLTENPLKNPALASALIIFYHYQKGKNIYSNLVFPPDLEYFGKWYVQLMGESLGKKGKGITPTITTGTTDFHAIGQLYFDGPRDKLINFIFVENLGVDYKIGDLDDFSSIFPDIKGKKLWQLNRAIFEGVKRAYLKKELPFTETILPELDEKNLGFLFQMKMIEVILLAKLMKVNAFDQPGVELYKEETRKILKQ
jgi:glucose-6-phosphate isomerase